ncbi:LDL receptor repeat-containing protein egg-1-like isoform X2 [Tribolium madens]|uniref:LDL receptor repeat-containing protein egg-1-like isoform X2 n=1 Tax=Tribolium madens TaxID=41895 RepID=UPI001CF732A2|nr:LDL receptor repeat-containing protein egg-1-like isoform X2 [Tribolium madens]
MILHPNTVQLTKIHYYNGEIPTISREIFDNCVNSRVKITKNLFRHRCVLKINEIGGGGEKFQWRLVVYVIVFICLMVALISALFFTCFRQKNVTLVPTLKLSNTTNLGSFVFCQNCTSGHICLKLTEVESPKCLQPLDRKDPTGCGGFCSVNTQFCQLLDLQHQIYQCSNLTNTLKCPLHTFNCGNMCVNMTKRCDGFIHCRDKSDEFQCDCDLETHFQCGNATSCLPKAKKCNGFVDCWDKNDEIGMSQWDSPMPQR